MMEELLWKGYLCILLTKQSCSVSIWVRVNVSRMTRHAPCYSTFSLLAAVERAVNTPFHFQTNGAPSASHSAKITTLEQGCVGCYRTKILFPTYIIKRLLYMRISEYFGITWYCGIGCFYLAYMRQICDRIALFIFGDILRKDSLILLYIYFYPFIKLLRNH